MMKDEAEFEVHFLALNEHLKEMRPIFDAFCARHGFSYVNPLSLGRYPRIRIEKSGAVNIWFDLWMELDEHGRRSEQFRRELPYELSGGAYVDVQDGSKYGVRFGKSLQCFGGIPFEEVSALLPQELEKHLPTLEGWDDQYLKAHGQRKLLGT